jgi:hypothetical protein
LKNDGAAAMFDQTFSTLFNLFQLPATFFSKLFHQNLRESAQSVDRPFVGVLAFFAFPSAPWPPCHFTRVCGGSKPDFPAFPAQPLELWRLYDHRCGGRVQAVIY